MYLSNTEEPIVVERIIQSSAYQVWTALTEPESMKLWFFEMIPNFKAEVGFTTSFNVKAPSRDYYHIWTVTEVENNKKISYTWTYKEMEGSADLTFEIEELPDSKVKVKVINRVLENFPKYPEFTIESCTGGWNYFMDRLVIFLSSKSK